MLVEFLYIANVAITVLIILLILRAVASWIPQVSWRYRRITKLHNRITEPLLKPFRELVPPQKTRGIDVSPALAIITLDIIRRVVSWLLTRQCGRG